MIDRDEAYRIAAREVVARGLGTVVSGVYASDSLPGRQPCAYGVTMDDAWIAYTEQPITGPRSSTIIVISRATGKVLYSGSANDEG